MSTIARSAQSKRVAGFAGLVLLLGVSLAGARAVQQRSAQVMASSQIFAGVPAAAVEEVLANPTARRNVQGLSKSQAAVMWRGQALNFILCRDMLAVYKAWISDGVPPEKLPESPVQADSLADYYAGFEDDVRSGDIAKFRTDFTGDGSCGTWVPAVPGDVDGRTVAQVVRDLG